MTTSLAAALAGLSTREAIKDVLYRCVAGIDAADAALFDSAFTEDASFDLNGTVMSSLASIKSGCYDVVAHLDTTHVISNERISYDAGTAKLTATAMAQHYRKGEGMMSDAEHLFVGSLYWVDLVLDGADGVWKIKSWVMKSTSMEGTYAVLKN